MMRYKGNILLEFLFVLPIFGLTLVFVTEVFQQYEERRLMIQAVRLGTAIQRSGIIEEEEARSVLSRVFQQDVSKFHWKVVMGRSRETPSSRFYHLVKTKIDSLEDLSIPSRVFIPSQKKSIVLAAETMTKESEP